MFKDLILYPKQLTAVKTTSRLTIFVSGIRGGKTVGAGAHFAIKRIIEQPTVKGLIFSNTVKQLNLSTLHEFMKVLAFYDMYEGEQYVTNKNPERYFGYKSMFDEHRGVWSFRNGAQLLTYSLESAIRGTEFGWAWGDEVQDAKKEQLDIQLGRMSGSANPNTLYTLTPPKSNPDVNEMVFPQEQDEMDDDTEDDNVMQLTQVAKQVFHDPDKDITYIYGSTYDNEENLPEGYIPMLKSIYDPITFNREVMGEEATNVTNRFTYAFEKRHISRNAIYREGQIVYLSFDFNVDPGTCIVWQQGIERGVPWIHYIDEFVVEDANVYKMCERIYSKYGHNQMMATGDASSRKREFSQRSNLINTWTIIKKELKLSDSQMVLVPNPKVADNRILCNSILANHPDIIFNPVMKHTIRDLRFVQVDPYGQMIKKDRKNIHQRADLLDCFRYSLNTFHSTFIERARRKAS